MIVLPHINIKHDLYKMLLTNAYQEIYATNMAVCQDISIEITSKYISKGGAEDILIS